MNEIDPANNGSATTIEIQPDSSATAVNATKSPLLSSLLQSTKLENHSNGQQQDKSTRKNVHSMMASGGGTSAIVTNPQYDETSAFMTRKTASTQSTEASSELEAGTISSSHSRKYSNLNELLQRNNNNNKVSTASEATAKSILENCLLKPSPVKSRLESQFYHTMDESDFHHHHHPSTSAVLHPYGTEENRKVEPLKINLHREPIRTVIKLPPNPYESPTKITIKPIPPPADRQNSITPSSTPATISPTLSSSSLSSESSFDNNDNHNTRPSAIQVIPKLHIRNLADGSLNHDQSELHIVPKLTICGLNSPQASSVSHNDQPTKDHSVTSILDNNSSCSPAIPKLTIKKDNNASEGFYHLNNDSNSIPKLHIKASNHHHHHHHHTVAQPKDGVKLTIKPVPEPAVPKLTIKTMDNDTLIVANTTNVDTTTEQPPQQTAIPKLTIKANQQPAVPKVTIRPVLRRQSEEQSPEESIPKITLKAINNSNTPVPTFEKVVPKLIVKLPKEPAADEDDDEKDLSSRSTTPSPNHQVPKVNIKPIPEKELLVPKPVKNCVDSTSPSDMKFSINRLIGSAETAPIESDTNILNKPLEINTTTSVIKNSDSGQDSPRIILKFNKTNSESITSEIVPQPTDNTQKQSAGNKRTHQNDDAQEIAKRAKVVADDDVILISDTSNEASNHKNHQPTVSQHDNHTSGTKMVETKTNLTGILSRNLRQSRRNCEPAKPVTEAETTQSVKDETVSDVIIDPLALSNDGNGNSNSVDELVTPKRGRGRPKKIQKPVVEEDPLELPADDQTLDDSHTGAESDSKKTPGVRGGRRGRGRLKRTVEVIKNGKPIQITLEGHDDDDSPSFSLYNRSIRGGFGSGRRSRGGKTIRGRSAKSTPFLTPERSKDGLFMSPSNSDLKDLNNRKRIFNTPSLFEEDTRMSIGGDSSTIFRMGDLQSNEESQSSLLSSASNTVEGSATKKRHKKMEVCEPEHREFSIDMLAEYDWPQNEPPRSRDSYMIQEQIAEYLGVKSFKRKYPDLMRRPVDMEERNYLFENGLATEKMCDLGLTAVYASEVLDIMCNDYPEKYEEYQRYQREKAFRNARLRLETAVVDRSQMQKDKSITSASEWNTRFNKDRRENRRCCMDLQNFLIQKSTPIRNYKVSASVTHQSHYPVALVPGQFSEHYIKYTPEQLACYPINTVLVDHKKLEQYMAAHPNEESSDEGDSSSGSDDGESSSLDSDSSDSDSSSSSEDEDDPLCLVCSQTQYINQYRQPEKFIKCSTCKNQAHPSCIGMSSRMYVRSLAYNWQCSNCKTCCKCRKAKDNKMLYCVQCDRGFHIYCLGLRNIPEGQYHCDNCTICSECGARSAEGHFNPTLTQQQRQDLAMIAAWNHEFTVNSLTKIREHKASLCLPCFRQSNQKNVD